ncbi:MAG: hypothetical protein RQ952_03340 [Thermoproteota archaeon]|jgi:uncharacterized membrane protein|nr:hypothetical protein [Thermoproteota archaeon]
MVDKLFLLGFLLILIGFLALFLALLLYFPNIETSGAFVITIFFIPIAGSFGKYGEILLIFLVVLTILLLIINFFFLRRKA